MTKPANLSFVKFTNLANNNNVTLGNSINLTIAECIYEVDIRTPVPAK